MQTAPAEPRTLPWLFYPVRGCRSLSGPPEDEAAGQPSELTCALTARRGPSGCEQGGQVPKPHHHLEFHCCCFTENASYPRAPMCRGRRDRSHPGEVVLIFHSVAWSPRHIVEPRVTGGGTGRRRDWRRTQASGDRSIRP